MDDKEEEELLEKLKRLGVELLAPNWISIKDKLPPNGEPIVYARFKEGKWAVGIAYWTVSQVWCPELGSTACPEGYTHWLPLPPPPEEKDLTPCEDCEGCGLNRYPKYHTLVHCHGCGGTGLKHPTKEDHDKVRPY